MFSAYGTQAMVLSFEYVASGSIRVTANGRNGSENYNELLSVPAGAPSKIKFYYNASDRTPEPEDEDKRQMYVDELKIRSGRRRTAECGGDDHASGRPGGQQR